MIKFWQSKEGVDLVHFLPFNLPFNSDLSVVPSRSQQILRWEDCSINIYGKKTGLLQLP